MASQQPGGDRPTPLFSDKEEHDYHDYANLDENALAVILRQNNIMNPQHEEGNSFPARLHYVLDDVHADGMSHIIGWQPHGRCFIVLDQQLFFEKILPLWFRVSQYSSFQRQLNLYGFKRITKGPDKGAYYHELFLRSKRFLAYHIRRSKVKGTGVRRRCSPETEPNFYAMPFLPPAPTRTETGSKQVPPPPPVPSDVQPGPAQASVSVPSLQSVTQPTAVASNPLVAQVNLLAYMGALGQQGVQMGLMSSTGQHATAVGQAAGQGPVFGAFFPLANLNLMASMLSPPQQHPTPANFSPSVPPAAPPVESEQHSESPPMLPQMQSMQTQQHVGEHNVVQQGNGDYESIRSPGLQAMTPGPASLADGFLAALATHNQQQQQQQEQPQRENQFVQDSQWSPPP